MRIIIKPFGMVVLALAVGGAFAMVVLKKPGVGLTSSLGSGANLVRSERWKFYTEKGAVGGLTPVKETVSGAVREGVKVEATQPGEQSWNIGVSQALGVPFKGGEKLQLRFWGRSAVGSQATFILQRNVPGFPDCFKKTISLTPEWREYKFTLTTTAMAQWESMVAVHAGFKAGSVELVDVQLVRA